MKNYLIFVGLAVAFSLGAGTKINCKGSLNSTAISEAIGSANFYNSAGAKIKMDLEINTKERVDSMVVVHF